MSEFINYIVNKQAICAIILLITGILSGQNELKSNQLYKDQTPLEIKLGYSNKDLNRNTNDSTFIITAMAYLNEGKWAEIEVNLRAREISDEMNVISLL